MFLFIAIAVILILAWWGCPGKTECFADRPAIGKFWAERAMAGAVTSVAAGEKTLLHDGTFRVWSCETAAVIKVTVDGLTNVLYLKSPGRIENLPAALGGIPAHENYTAIFNSGRPIMIELVPLDTAQLEVNQGRSHCISTIQYSEAVCNEEFAEL